MGPPSAESNGRNQALTAVSQAYCLRLDKSGVDNNTCDGILGLDFIKHFNCILDYKDNDGILILRPLNYNHIKVPINLTTSNHSMILPARSEVIRKFEIKEDGEILIPNQQVEEGVYIAYTKTEAINCYIRYIYM